MLNVVIDCLCFKMKNYNLISSTEKRSITINLGIVNVVKVRGFLIWLVRKHRHRPLARKTQKVQLNRR